MLNELSKEELLDLLNAYDRYILDTNYENRYQEGWYPMCISEFYDCEYLFERKSCMTFDEAKQRSDYHFYTEEIERFITQLQNGQLDGDEFSVDQEGVRGCAVLEIGYLDIEVNLYSYAQTEPSASEQDMTPKIEYFCCVKIGEETDDWRSDNTIGFSTDIDWQSEQWKDSLEESMFKSLVVYAIKRDYSFDKPNRYELTCSSPEPYENEDEEDCEI